MKNIWILLFGLLPLLGEAQTEAYTVKVEGMGCAFCANGVETKLKSWKSLRDLKIDLETGIVTFTLPKEDARSGEEVAKLIGKAGYTARQVTVARSSGETEAYQPPVSESGKGIIANFPVSGECDMCKTRIEKAASKVKGVQSAVWDTKHQHLKVEFDPAKTSEADIQSAVARAGHDTPMFKAPDSVYGKLPACCQYRD